MGPDGVFGTDVTFDTGMRVMVSIPKKTWLGLPDKGLNLVFFEQGDMQLTEDKMLLMASLIVDVAAFLGGITILSLEIDRIPNQPRSVRMGVRYVADDNISKTKLFRWKLGI